MEAGDTPATATFVSSLPFVATTPFAAGASFAVPRDGLQQAPSG
jgi:hypothetical protein